MSFSLIEGFITIFIGMGPVKVLLVYIAMTKHLEKEVRKQMATRIVLVAGSVGIGLFILGAVVQNISIFRLAL